MDAERTPESVLFEADYWRQVLAELGELAASIPRASDAIATGATLAAACLIDGNLPGAIEAQSAGMSGALGNLAVAIQQVNAVAELAAGRCLALHREAGLEPPGGGV